MIKKKIIDNPSDFEESGKEGPAVSEKTARGKYLEIIKTAKEDSLKRWLRERQFSEEKYDIEEKGIPHILSDIALFEGLSKLKTIGEKAELPSAGSFTEEFRNACVSYIFTGAFPKVSEQVKAQLDKLPVSKTTGRHILDVLSAGEKKLSILINNYKKYIEPCLVELREVDIDLRATESESFIPSTDDSSLEKLTEEEIRMRVEPFCGGHFREQVMDDVNWQTMEVVATGVPSVNWQTPEKFEPKEGSEHKIYRYSGTNGPTDVSEEKIPMLRRAVPLSSSLTKGWQLRQTENGCFLLERKKEGHGGEADAQKGRDYAFDFIILNQAEKQEWQKKRPKEGECYIPEDIIATLGQETKDFLGRLKELNITTAAKARRVVGRTRKELIYVNDSKIGDMYKAAGRQYFSALEREKKADCDVANFYALAQMRALGIPCRMVIGYHVRKDPRFAFAAVAGQKHAWLEYFDQDKGEWVETDATPPKKDENKEDEEEGGGGGGETGFTDREDFKTEPEESDDLEKALLVDEDFLQQLREALEKAGEQASAPEADRAKEQFKERENVSFEEWGRVQKYIKDVNQIVIPKECTIAGDRESTVGEEWKKIFKMLEIILRMPRKKRPMEVRQSLGEELVDSTAAAVDLIAGEDDPYGYQTKKVRSREEKVPLAFSNDFLLDLTASMKAEDDYGNTLLEQEKRFVMTALYHGWLANEQLRQREATLRPEIRRQLQESSYITNHIFSIHGGNNYREITEKGEKITIKRLVEIFREFDKTTRGAGNMLGALRNYHNNFSNDAETRRKVSSGEMLKTLTIISDGNLWCSLCGEESCTYQLHTGIIQKIKQIVKELRDSGIQVNAIGFTNHSRPIAEIFKDDKLPEAVKVVKDVRLAIPQHHRQVREALSPLIKTAKLKFSLKP